MTFKTITIPDPEDLWYPLQQEQFLQPLLYHGTSSIYSPIIDINGWSKETCPYTERDLNSVIDIYRRNKLGESENYHLVNVALGCMQKYKQRGTNWTNSYWHVRSYASNLTGESIKHLLLLIDEILSKNQSNSFSNLNVEEKQLLTIANKNVFFSKKTYNKSAK